MPELRKDPLVGRWVIIATERARRPDEFLPAQRPPAAAVPGDCPWCEGGEGRTPREIFSVRHGGGANQPGWEVRVVPAGRPVLRVEGTLQRKGRGLYDLINGIGAHELIIESPQHVANLADLPEPQIAAVIRTYVARIADLERDQRLKYALLFKNYGETTAQAHAHSELMAMPINPARLKEELLGAQHYFAMKERCLFCDMLRQELEEGRRLAVTSEQFVVIAPFASRFPFELWVLPRAHAADFTSISPGQQQGLAQVLKLTLRKIGQALRDPPYHFMLHTAPFRRPQRGAWRTIDDDFHWHLELMPRLTRVAGFEWGSGFYINPTPPEDAAGFLSGLEIHRDV